MPIKVFQRNRVDNSENDITAQQKNTELLVDDVSKWELAMKGKVRIIPPIIFTDVYLAHLGHQGRFLTAWVYYEEVPYRE